ncbi:methyl-accepting chemotaxis protein [Pseudomonas sp. LS1212]|uniref:methyl-accepting chemotaxis protein n=1 Tax=Pseudomonas sp. LS1212 TaxID=2972478 RepID=UPI0038CD7CE7
MVAQQVRSGSQWGIGGFFVVAALTLLIGSALVGRSIVGTLERLRAAIVKAASSKDFTGHVDTNGAAEVGQAAQAFNELQERLRLSLREVSTYAESVSTASGSLSAMSQQVSQSSSGQSEAAQEMAMAIREMTSSIQSISEGTQRALELAREAACEAERGGKITLRNSVEMERILGCVSVAGDQVQALGVQTIQVSGVMKVIRDVADQTNLLALNAAIEAARAGDLGRGFAVVADEVRQLAERTAGSTEEISQVVQEMQRSAQSAVGDMTEVVSGVEGGRRLSDEASDCMQAIHSSAGRVSQTVDEIAALLAEQSEAAQNLALRVQQVTDMVAENNRSAREAAAVAADLDGLSASLREVAGAFRV